MGLRAGAGAAGGWASKGGSVTIVLAITALNKWKSWVFPSASSLHSVMYLFLSRGSPLFNG